MRKNSDNLKLSDQSTPIGIFEKPRKFTENILENRKKPVQTSKNNNDKSTTIEGTSVVTPFMQSIKDSGFGEVAVPMISTPVMKKKTKRVSRGNIESPSKTSQINNLMLKSLGSGLGGEKPEMPAP